MYHIPKGVFDILPDDPEVWRSSHLWQYIEGMVREIAHEYGFFEIRTPMFESTELFCRSIGKETDIVTKEMYTFEDLGKRSMTLRPEGTAAVLRAFIEKNLAQQSPIHKFFYIGPMFRYERQQAGRYRQHHQFGVEALGSNSPYQDAEVIDLLHTLLTRLGLKGLGLQINSIGSLEERTAFRSALKNYLKSHLSDLSVDSQRRFETNPLRILDSKCEKDQKILENAPSISSYVDQEHFNQVLTILNQQKIPYTINPLLVRGLDYYNNTVFEITAGELGAQNSLGGGGRYDGLMSELGGPQLPAFGFGCGIERVIHTLLGQKINLPKKHSATLLFIPLDDEAMSICFQWVTTLRSNHIAAEMDLSGKKLKNSMRYDNNRGVRFVAIVGDNEVKEKRLEIKEMETGTVESLSFDDLLKRLQKC